MTHLAHKQKQRKEVGKLYAEKILALSQLLFSKKSLLYIPTAKKEKLAEDTILTNLLSRRFHWLPTEGQAIQQETTNQTIKGIIATFW